MALRAGDRRKSEVENGPTSVLETFETSIEVGGFPIQLGEPGTCLAELGDKLGIVSQDVRNSVDRIARRRIKRGLFDQVRRQIESGSHNRHYIKPGAEPRLVSAPGST